LGKVFAFDEAHAETWTTNLNRAVALNDLCPEYCYYGHVSDLIQESIDGVERRLDRSWDETTLSGIDMLVIAHPAKPGLEVREAIGNPVFSSTEISWICEFVRRGGGLFVLGEWDYSHWDSNVNELLEKFGLMFNNDTLASSQCNNAHLVARHFQCVDVEEEHPATDGVRRVTYHRGCSITTTEGRSSRSLIKSPDGQTVFAVATFGGGRVAAIGDTDLFSVPFIGHADNARLLAKIVQWLSRDEISKPSWHGIREKSYELRSKQHNIDVSQVPGEHALDCSQFQERLLNIYKVPGLPNPYTEIERFLCEAELRFHELPRGLRQQIIKFKRDGNEHGVLLLRRLPTDNDLSLTPADSRRSSDKQTFLSEFWLATMAGGLGDAISYSKEKDGEVFQNICPTKKNEENLSSESSKILLDFHTETAFHPFMPDFLILYCLRPDHDHEAQTFFASTRHIVESLPLRYRAVLFEDIYKTGIDFSFGSPNGLQGNGPVLSVLHGNPYDPFMKFDLDLMVSANAEGHRALDQMKMTANKVKDFVKLDAGDLLIIDNRRAVHGRSVFTPRYDGYDRWLQRVFVVRDLAFSEEDRRAGERIIDTEFFV
jgi:hypothetical protein